MQNTNNIKKALEDLEHETQHENQEISAKSAQLKEVEQKKSQLEQDIKRMEAEIKQKEVELDKDKRLEPTLKREIDLLTHKRMENQGELQRIQRDYEQSIRESKLDNVHHN